MLDIRDNALILMKEFLGKISENFRIIWIAQDEECLNIHVVLEHESERDKKNLESIANSLERIYKDTQKFILETTIGSERIRDIPAAKRAILYGRREDQCN
ncbi:hypothetical protein [Emcibacter sp.]|uniref:hypothetical protein n=1 Tax=Emcibacter sp. TaxID=1979954 RepID=UPI002AA7978C|nr:hypothetical protein [Emcibacter sp.]